MFIYWGLGWWWRELLWVNGGAAETGEKKFSTLSFRFSFSIKIQPKPKIQKTPQVYKRALDVEYSLKMKASRAVFSEISKRFSTMPFSLRALSTPGARLGVIECVNHYLLQAYPVLHERQGERVAQLKTTVLLMPGNGHSDRITQAPLQAFESEKKVEDELVKKLLATSLKPKKKKPAAAAKAAAAAPAAAAAKPAA